MNEELGSSPVHAAESARGWMQITTDSASHLPFSAAVEANGFVFVSGQASVDGNGVIVPGDSRQRWRHGQRRVQQQCRSVACIMPRM
jgi:enamine deaminase RidA (YjgF/YER057c/UK114 family)